MNRILCLALSVATFTLIAAPPAQAQRTRALDVAAALEDEAKELKDDYREHLKDIRRWKPRGREEELYSNMEKLEEAADELTKGLGRGWSRQADHAFAVTIGFAEEVARGIGDVRDRKVRKKWANVETIIHGLSSYASGGRGRYDDHGSRGGYGRAYDDHPEYDDRYIEERRDRDRRDYRETRTVRFW